MAEWSDLSAAQLGMLITKVVIGLPMVMFLFAKSKEEFKAWQAGRLHQVCRRYYTSVLDISCDYSFDSLFLGDFPHGRFKDHLINCRECKEFLHDHIECQANGIKRYLEISQRPYQWRPNDTFIQKTWQHFLKCRSCGKRVRFESLVRTDVTE